MRKQYHLRPGPAGLRAWDIDRLVTLSEVLKPELIPLAAIRELDEAYWSTGYDKFLTCREIAEHARLIQVVDLGFPVILSSDGRVMDGMHRIAKAFLLGQTHVRAVRFLSIPSLTTQESIPMIYPMVNARPLALNEATPNPALKGTSVCVASPACRVAP